jgi:mono/diheme cytochrome c family protein
MRCFLSVLVFLAVVPALLCAAAIPGDPDLGAKIFESQRCVACHSINGEGGKSAPDLGRTKSRFYSPASMAAYIWNHGPKMWSAMKAANIQPPKMTESEAGDLYAFLYSRSYFATPGDAGRGKRVFEAKGCADCHGAQTAQASGAKPVSQWESVNDPVLLSAAMWNHSAKMREAIAAKGKSWPTLTAAETRDLAVFLRTAPGRADKAPDFRMASSETGRMLFGAKGCTDCHTGAKALDRFPGRTMDEFIAAMWNHAPHMSKTPELRPEEIQRIAGYLWASQYFEARGNAKAGEQTFSQKGCVTCHGGGNAPKLGGSKANAITFVTATWAHGPNMLQAMEQKRVRWPQLTQSEVNNILAFLNSNR